MATISAAVSALEAASSRAMATQTTSVGFPAFGKLVSPARRRICMERVRERFGVSERLVLQLGIVASFVMGVSGGCLMPSSP